MPRPQHANGPHIDTIEAHTHHLPDSPGSQCAASHTLRFVMPAQTEKLGIPNACHKDKTPVWATAAIKGWADRSPWRVDQ